MTEIILPNKSRTKKDPVLSADWYENDVAIKEVVEGELTNANLSGSAGITRANLAAESKPVTWYTPKVIATEQSRTNTAYGKLETADEIAEVVLAENGIIEIAYSSTCKSSVSAEGSVAIFLGANQLKNEGVNVSTATIGTGFRRLGTASNGGLATGEFGTAMATTGELVGAARVASYSGGFISVFAAAGTYTVSVQFKAASGSITAKERKLWVRTWG